MPNGRRIRPGNMGQRPERGRQPGGFGLGPSGECVCPACGEKIPHQRGIPCFTVDCPKCKAKMTRVQ